MNDTMNLWVIHTICEYLFLLETCFVSLQPSTQPLNIITREKKLALTHFPIKISFQFNFNCIILTSKCDKISPLQHYNNIYGFCLCADYHYYLWKFDSNWSLVTKSNYPLVFWFSICFFFRVTSQKYGKRSIWWAWNSDSCVWYNCILIDSKFCRVSENRLY